MTDLRSSQGTDVPGAGVGMQRRAVRSFVWAALAFGGNRLAIFLATLALARILAPADFGVVAAGMTLVLYLEIALDLGVGAALVYEQEEGITRRVHTAFTMNLLVASVLTGAGMLAAPAVARFFQVPGSEAIFRVLFGYLLIRGAGQVQDAILKRDLSFGRRGVVDVARGVVRAAVSVALAVAGYGAWAIVWGLLAGELVGTALSWWMVRYRPRLMLDRGALRALLGFGAAVLALKVVDAVGLDADYLVVGNRLGATQLGYYTVAYRLPELVLLNLYWIFSSVAFPVYAKARSTGAAAFSTAMLRALRLITLFALPAGVGLALVARDAVLVLFSAKWAPSIMPMVLLSLAMAISSLGYASGDIFPAVGKPGTLLALNLPVTVLGVAAMVLVAPRGIVAVAAVHLLVAVWYEPVRLLIANRLVGATARDTLAALRPGLCALAGVLACAGPLRLLLPPGAGTLALLVAAGVGGALAALALGSRDTFAELTTLGRQVVERA
jgi:lipopolysaccharide exporter